MIDPRMQERGLRVGTRHLVGFSALPPRHLAVRVRVTHKYVAKSCLASGGKVGFFLRLVEREGFP
jgi:hypothetical protein